MPILRTQIMDSLYLLGMSNDKYASNAYKNCDTDSILDQIDNDMKNDDDKIRKEMNRRRELLKKSEHNSEKNDDSNK